MQKDNKFGLLYNRAWRIYAVRFRGSDETDEDFSARDLRTRTTAQQNKELNDLSRDVGEALNEREWPSMYLKHFIQRIEAETEAQIDLRGSLKKTKHLENGSLQVSDEAVSTIDHLAIIEVSPALLEQRKLDAQIGQERAWNSVDSLIDTLIRGIHPDRPRFYRLF